MKVFLWRGLIVLFNLIQCTVSELFTCNMRILLPHHWENLLGYMYIQLKINVSYLKQDMTYCTVPCIFPSQDFSASFCDFVLSVYNPRRGLTQRFRIATTPITVHY